LLISLPENAEAFDEGIMDADRVFFKLTRPMNPWKDYRAARATFTRFLTEYPRSPWGVDARVWQDDADGSAPA